MRSRCSDILVLTPRGGEYNHRYVVAEGGSLDASGCGRVYRQAKDAVGENGFGCGRLNPTDGGWFAAARHVVAQQETAGRRGAEWLIVVDPRIGGLDDAGRRRMQRELEDRLSRLSPEVLNQISWNDHAESDVIPDPTLERWSQAIAPMLAEVRVPTPPSSEKEIGGRVRSGVSGANRRRIAAMVAILIVGYFVLAQVFQLPSFSPPPVPGIPGGAGQVAEANSFLSKAATTLDIQSPDESKVIGRLAGLFSDASTIKAAPGKSLKALLDDLRRSAMGEDRMGADLLKDDEFWRALARACPKLPAHPDCRAFLPPDDVAVVGQLPDPSYVRILAEVVRGIRELDTVEAKPDDANLVPLYKSIVNESESISRQPVDESLTIFTRSDVAIARRLLHIFQDEDVKRVIFDVRTPQGTQESLEAWMRTLGSPGRKGSEGLFSEAYFRLLSNIAEEKGSRPKQRCIELLRRFCAKCTELVRNAPARQAVPTTPAEGQQRPVPAGR